MSGCPWNRFWNKDYHHNINCNCWLTLQFPFYHVLIKIDWLINLHTVQARTKGTMQTWNWCNGCVRLDEGTCQSWRASASARTHQAGKDFSSVIHCDSFALWGIVVKKKTISRVWRSSIVAHSKELFMSPDKFGDVEGFVCIITQHPSFICNCNSRFIHLKNTSHFLKSWKSEPTASVS